MLICFMPVFTPLYPAVNYEVLALALGEASQTADG
jgi:hypothetical protein